MTDVTAEQLAQTASEPGVFNFLDRLRGRNYPADDAVVYLDEAAAYNLQRAESRLAGLTDPKEIKKAEADVKALLEAVRASRYVIHMRSISSEAYDKLVDDAEESFPYEYDETTSPLTGRVTREIKPTEERDRYFRGLLWSNFIESVTDPEGNVSPRPSVDEAVAMRYSLPIDAVRLVDETLVKLRMAVEWMDGIQDEGFFPTP